MANADGDAGEQQPSRDYHALSQMLTAERLGSYLRWSGRRSAGGVRTVRMEHDGLSGRHAHDRDHRGRRTKRHGSCAA